MIGEARADLHCAFGRLPAVRAELSLAVLLMLIGVVTPSARAYTHEVLYSFSGADGANPLHGLVVDTAGSIYGVTSAGGAYGFGTIFRIISTGMLTVLHSFDGGTDGASPSSLTIDASGISTALREAVEFTARGPCSSWTPRIT